MLFRIFSAPAMLLQLAATALAAPAAVALPDALVPRAGCPVISRYDATSIVTKHGATRTITDGISYVGSITSTRTESEFRIITRQETVISPSVTTYPKTTSTIWTEAGPTSTVWWTAFAGWVTIPGYAPSSLCEMTTFINWIPGTTTGTISRELSYATVTTRTTGHVSTTTQVSWSTTTRTITTPGATAYATTQTVAMPFTPADVAITTITSTIYEKGCKEWACQTQK